MVVTSSERPGQLWGEGVFIEGHGKGEGSEWGVMGKGGACGLQGTPPTESL